MVMCALRGSPDTGTGSSQSGRERRNYALSANDGFTQGGTIKSDNTDAEIELWRVDGKNCEGKRLRVHVPRTA